MVTDAQTKYLASQGGKLSKFGTSSKQIWTIINTTFLKKIKNLVIPPILLNNAFITDVQEKADLFNTYFAQQCTLIDGSCLPPFMLLTEKKLSVVLFYDSDIADIIENLKPDKSHGWDGISIRKNVRG